MKASNTGCGFDDHFLNLFSEKLIGFPEMARYRIISFDEIKVRESLDVNLKTMEFKGVQDYGRDIEVEEDITIDDKANYGLVFMFSSLSYEFHQPIGVFGSKSATKATVLCALFLQAVFAVEVAGGKVMGFVSDGASPNKRLWTESGISGKIDELNFRLENPVDESRFIYAVSDAPHLLKCIRNRLLEKKFLKVETNVQ